MTALPLSSWVGALFLVFMSFRPRPGAIGRWRARRHMAKRLRTAIEAPRALPGAVHLNPRWDGRPDTLRLREQMPKWHFGLLPEKAARCRDRLRCLSARDPFRDEFGCLEWHLPDCPRYEPLYMALGPPR